MNPDFTGMDSTLDRAASEIRAENVPEETIEAAAARVWIRLTEPGEHIRDCAGFQALMPDYRARRLPVARALLLEDHLHECVSCRHVFEGQVPALEPRPRPAAVRKVRSQTVRWAIAAGAIAAGGLIFWLSIAPFGAPAGRGLVQSVNGTLFEVSSAGLRRIASGEALADGTEIRTGRDSGAMLRLRDGSLVEMRERSGFSTSQADGDVTVHLGRGSIIVQAARRRSGHLYIATADCRVAVTGTVFSVSSGVKGSRVSVMAGEVHVVEDHRETILHSGDQVSTSESLAPAPLRDDFSWSHNPALLKQLAAVRENLSRLPLPAVRYSSRLLGLLPDSTIFFASVPNLAEYLAEAQNIFRQGAEQNPELRAWLAGPGASIVPVLEKLRAANEYLGDEIAIFGTSQHAGPVFLAETRRDGFREFLKSSGLPLESEIDGRLAWFSPNGEALKNALDSSFQRTPFYARIAEAYREGAGLLLCADLARMAPHPMPEAMRYLVAKQTEVRRHMETRADIGFDGPRTGLAAWLGPPTPMGALDYISPEAAFVATFATRDPAALLAQLPEPFRRHGALGVDEDAAASLGGEFAIALDGPPFPVPSWKAVAEVYDTARFQSAVRKAVAAYQLHLAEEVSGGRTFYGITAPRPNPLTEAHYTFAGGYVIAAPTRTLVARALEVQATGGGIARSPAFRALLPRDGYPNVSALIYQNFGPSLAPFAGLLGPNNAQMGGMKPFLVAAYGAPDRIALASTGDLLGAGLNKFLSGSVSNMIQSAAPWTQLLGTIAPPSPSR